MDEIREKLEKEGAIVSWEMLQLHAERGALICVSSELDLVDAALAVAQDEAVQVEEWIGSGALYKPTMEQLEAWEAKPQKVFKFVIVQPFVLASEHADMSDAVH